MYGFCNVESMDIYSQQFSLNAQGTSINYFQFLKKMELHLLLTLVGTWDMYKKELGMEEALGFRE